MATVDGDSSHLVAGEHMTCWIKDLGPWRAFESSTARSALQRNGSTTLRSALGGMIDRRSIRPFVATLHALRDSLPVHEAVFLGDYIPILLRGLYCQGWHLPKYSSFKSRDAFLERIREGVHRDPGIDAEQVAEAVVALLAERLPASELEDIKAVMPKALRGFWPA
jgi:uncharacterized protein (DUF2267 family)